MSMCSRIHPQNLKTPLRTPTELTSRRYRRTYHLLTSRTLLVTRADEKMNAIISGPVRILILDFMDSRGHSRANASKASELFKCSVRFVWKIIRLQKETGSSGLIMLQKVLSLRQNIDDDYCKS